jgi:hypothetical protein
MAWNYEATRRTAGECKGEDVQRILRGLHALSCLTHENK